MKTKLKAFLQLQAKDANNSVRGTIMAMVGGYVVYLAIQMIQTTLQGDTTMSLALTIVLSALMILAGILVFALGAYIFWIGWQREKAARSPSEEKSESCE